MRILKRVEKLEGAAKPLFAITKFRMIPDDRLERHNDEMRKSGFSLVRNNGMFQLWEECQS